MFCWSCGKEISDDAVFCPHCGKSQSGEYSAPQPNYTYQRQPRPDDASSVGWGILGFFFPIVGLILFLIWKDDYPLRSKSCGIGALVSVISGVALGLVWVFVFIIMFAILI